MSGIKLVYCIFVAWRWTVKMGILRYIIRGSPRTDWVLELFCCAALQDNPAPGSYDVARSYDQTQSKMEPRPPRSDAARRRHESFLSSSDRFAPLRDAVAADADNTLPGHMLICSIISPNSTCCVTTRHVRRINQSVVNFSQWIKY